MKFVAFVQQKRFADAWSEIEMMARDAPTQRAGDQQLVARLAAARVSGPRSVNSPNAVTLITSGPSCVFVSPPAIATSNSAASGNRPS